MVSVCNAFMPRNHPGSRRSEIAYLRRLAVRARHHFARAKRKREEESVLVMAQESLQAAQRTLRIAREAKA